jgi:hypothetical protein
MGMHFGHIGVFSGIVHYLLPLRLVIDRHEKNVIPAFTAGNVTEFVLSDGGKIRRIFSKRDMVISAQFREKGHDAVQWKSSAVRLEIEGMPGIPIFRNVKIPHPEMRRPPVAGKQHRLNNTPQTSVMILHKEGFYHVIDCPRSVAGKSLVAADRLPVRVGRIPLEPKKQNP